MDRNKLHFGPREKDLGITLQTSASGRQMHKKKHALPFRLLESFAALARSCWSCLIGFSAEACFSEFGAPLEQGPMAKAGCAGVLFGTSRTGSVMNFRKCLM